MALIGLPIGEMGWNLNIRVKNNECSLFFCHREIESTILRINRLNWEDTMKYFTAAAAAVALSFSASSAFAACDSGEIVIKFSHVTNTDKHPKGIAATLLEQRVNDEMNGKACLEVFRTPRFTTTIKF
jgi:hypothetical protein